MLVLLLSLLPVMASARGHGYHHHGGSSVSFGFGYGGGYTPYPAYGYYPAYPAYPVYQAPPVIVEREVVVEQVSPYDNYARPASNTRYDQGYCREFTRNVTINGRPERGYGTACQQPDGSWQVVN